MKGTSQLMAGIAIFACITVSSALKAQTGDELISAVTYQDLEKVKDLVEAGVDVNYREPRYGNTPLSMACQYNLVEIARYLMDKGADINLRTKTGHTPLMAAASGSETLFHLLLEKGADPLAAQENGTTALTMLVTGILMERMPLEAIDMLLNAGVNIDESAKSGQTEGYTCLMMAARNKRPDLVKYLVEREADINARAADGSTALSLAGKEDDQEMISLLKELGAK
jgi:ankyrin repeat protein